MITCIKAVDTRLQKLSAQGLLKSTQQSLFRRDGAQAYGTLSSVYGALVEVICLRGPFNAQSILVFANGLGVLTGDGSSFPQLTFGYAGAGPRIFTRFLAEAGFKVNHAQGFWAPLIIHSNGYVVNGTRGGDRIRWETGVRMDVPRFPMTKAKAL